MAGLHQLYGVSWIVVKSSHGTFYLLSHKLNLQLFEQNNHFQAILDIALVKAGLHLGWLFLWRVMAKHWHHQVAHIRSINLDLIHNLGQDFRHTLNRDPNNLRHDLTHDLKLPYTQLSWDTTGAMTWKRVPTHNLRHHWSDDPKLPETLLEPKQIETQPDYLLNCISGLPINWEHSDSFSRTADEALWLVFKSEHCSNILCVCVFRGPSVKRSSGMERSQSSTWDTSEENKNKLVKAASTSKLIAKVVKNAERCTHTHTLVMKWYILKTQS